MKSHLAISAEPLEENRDQDVLCGKQIVKAAFVMTWIFSRSIPEFAAVSNLKLCQKCVRKLLEMRNEEEGQNYLYACAPAEEVRHQEEVA